MTDRIEPALDEHWWERVRWLKQRGDLKGALLSMGTEELGLAGLIAAANEALKDDDPRKITHRAVATLRDAAREAELEGLRYQDLLALADVLESYLPPDPDERPPYPRLDADFEQKLNRQL
jgi:hypothetical protein